MCVLLYKLACSPVENQRVSNFALLPCLSLVLWWYLRSWPVLICSVAALLTHFVPGAPACDIHRGSWKGQWSTLCVWILASKNQFEPRSFGIILIKLPSYSQDGYQVSLKLCQTMTWWQKMPFEIWARLGQLVHGRHLNLVTCYVKFFVCKTKQHCPVGNLSSYSRYIFIRYFV